MWSAEPHTFKRKKKHWKLWAAIIVCFFSTCAVFTDAVYLISRMTAHQDESGDALPTSRQRGHGGFHSKHLKIKSKNATFYLPKFWPIRNGTEYLHFIIQRYIFLCMQLHFTADLHSLLPQPSSFECYG